MLIVRFLEAVGEARVARISAYMHNQWGYPDTTTKNTVYRLAKEGKIKRVGYGRYRRITDKGVETGWTLGAPADD